MALGVHELAGMPASRLRSLDAGDPSADGLLVLSETTVPPSALAPLLRLGDRPGFVVEDMTDLDSFVPIEGLDIPAGAGYVVRGIERGDEMSNWSPDEALPAIADAGRTPLTVNEGIHWALQVPEVIERNHCFMTIGSRRRTPKGSTRRADARPVDQQRHGARRQRAPRRPQGRLVLGRKPPHLAGIRLSRESGRRLSRPADAGASTSGATLS